MLAAKLTPTCMYLVMSVVFEFVHPGMQLLHAAQGAGV